MTTRQLDLNWTKKSFPFPISPIRLPPKPQNGPIIWILLPFRMIFPSFLLMIPPKRVWQPLLQQRNQNLRLHSKRFPSRQTKCQSGRRRHRVWRGRIRQQASRNERKQKKWMQIRNQSMIFSNHDLILFTKFVFVLNHKEHKLNGLIWKDKSSNLSFSMNNHQFAYHHCLFSSFYDNPSIT